MSIWIAILLLFLEMAYLFKILNFSALKLNPTYYHSKTMEYTLDYRTQKVIPIEITSRISFHLPLMFIH